MLLVSKKKKEKKNQVKLFSENCAYIYLIMELVFLLLLTLDLSIIRKFKFWLEIIKCIVDFFWLN